MLTRIISPSGRVEARIMLAGGELAYEVDYQGRPAVERSPLGLTADGIAFGRDVKCWHEARGVVRDRFAVRGGHAEAQRHGHTLTISLTHTHTGRAFTLEARVYDDGFAWRYVLPAAEQGEAAAHITGEASSWTLPAEAQVWLFERPNAWKLKSYAGEWISAPVEQLPLLSPEGPVQGTPLVAKLRQGYAAIMEAALYGYSGMRLEALEGRRFQAHFTEGEAGFEMALPGTTPWRVTLLAEGLDGLVNSDLIAGLNPPPDPALFARTDYIRPGRSVWRWWSRGTGSPEEERTMIDYAHRLGFEYTTIDEGWERWPEPWATLERLATEAAALGVGIFVWKRSSELDDLTDDRRALREFLDRVRAAGAAGVKIDFIDRESKDAIDFEIAALRLAAERQLMINFHGISKPTGEARTYPNEMTREGIRGLELNKMKEGPIPAWHNAALPFTRFLAGHGDYTPTGFSNPGATTYGHQLATWIAFTSPIQVLAEYPALLLEDEVFAPALAIIRDAPSVWDETRVLEPSEIGRLALLARRTGERWYVAGLHGDTAGPLSLELDLVFVGSGALDVELVCSPQPRRLGRQMLRLAPGERTLRLQLGAADGFVAVVKPAKEEGR
ncbi:glycoside hydrolase family 97 catalytic domain-containing protein [Paenibacillus sp. IB182496]|uniref:Glycoside hydrolase family 97 catalytic domain-containing protein n=1 Tax=Paenibacillus sabuli TaxID=2772509 RepID=A0A927GTS1_9BACL|nr:glycoside hydrolase family 97 protein [Paenibacillus sabuli]MBD2847591.1 glycoside hydrolase family 97 catalytic domain-containing protein [Paenibacillus sabuli]